MLLKIFSTTFFLMTLGLFFILFLQPLLPAAFLFAQPFSSASTPLSFLAQSSPHSSSSSSPLACSPQLPPTTSPFRQASSADNNSLALRGGSLSSFLCLFRRPTRPSFLSYTPRTSSSCSSPFLLFLGTSPASLHLLSASFVSSPLCGPGDLTSRVAQKRVVCCASRAHRRGKCQFRLLHSGSSPCGSLEGSSPPALSSSLSLPSVCSVSPRPSLLFRRRLPSRGRRPSVSSLFSSPSSLSPFLPSPVTARSRPSAASVGRVSYPLPSRPRDKISFLASSSSASSSSSSLSAASLRCPRCAIVTRRTPLVVVGHDAADPAASEEERGAQRVVACEESRQEEEEEATDTRKTSLKIPEGHGIAGDPVFPSDLPVLGKAAPNEGKPRETEGGDSSEGKLSSTSREHVSSGAPSQYGGSRAPLLPVVPVRLTVAKQLTSLLHLSATATRRRVFLPLPHLLSTFEAAERRRKKEEEEEEATKKPVVSDEKEEAAAGQGSALGEGRSRGNNNWMPRQREPPAISEGMAETTRDEGNTLLGLTFAYQEEQDVKGQEDNGMKVARLSDQEDEKRMRHLEGFAQPLGRRECVLERVKAGEQVQSQKRLDARTHSYLDESCASLLELKEARALKLEDFFAAARRVQKWIDHFGVPVRLGYRLQPARERSGADSSSLEEGSIRQQDGKKNEGWKTEETRLIQDRPKTGKDDEEEGMNEQDKGQEAGRRKSSSEFLEEPAGGGNGEEEENRSISVLETDEALQKFLSEYFEPLLRQYLQQPLCTHGEHQEGTSSSTSCVDDEGKETPSPNEKEESFASEVETRDSDACLVSKDAICTSSAPCMHRILKLRPCENSASSYPARSRLTLVLLPPPLTEWPPAPIAPFLLASTSSSSPRACAPRHGEGQFRLVSFYKFVGLSSPDETAQTLRLLWTPLGILGRVYVAEEGVNGQVAVPEENLPKFRASLQLVPELRGEGLAVNLDPWPMAAEEFSPGGATGDADSEKGNVGRDSAEGEEERGSKRLGAHGNDEWSKSHLVFPPPFEGLYIRVRRQVLADGFSEDEKTGDADGWGEIHSSERALEQRRLERDAGLREGFTSGQGSRNDLQVEGREEQERHLLDSPDVRLRKRTSPNAPERKASFDSPRKGGQDQSMQEELRALDWTDCGEELEPWEWESKLKEMFALQAEEKDRPTQMRQDSVGVETRKTRAGEEARRGRAPGDGISARGGTGQELTGTGEEREDGGEKESDGPAQESADLSRSVEASLSTCVGRRRTRKRLVLLDCRNTYETDIGRFKGAVPLGTSVFSESFGPGGAISKHLKALGIIKSERGKVERGDREPDLKDLGHAKQRKDGCLSERKEGFDGAVCKGEEGGPEQEAERPRPAGNPSSAGGSGRGGGNRMTAVPDENEPRSEKKAPEETDEVEVMMYCTGGIRCVKAGAYVKQVLGVDKVWRLKGGVLRYVQYLQGLERKERRSQDEATEEGRAAHDPQAREEAEVTEQRTRQEECQDEKENLTSEVGFHQTKWGLTEDAEAEDAEGQAGRLRGEGSERNREKDRGRVGGGETPTGAEQNKGTLSAVDERLTVGSAPSSLVSPRSSSSAPCLVASASTLSDCPPPSSSPSAASPLPVEASRAASSVVPSSLSSQPLSPDPSSSAASTAFLDRRSLFVGSLYVFDHRMTRRVTSHRLTSCSNCRTPCDRYINCLNPKCHIRVIQCPACSHALFSCCTPRCHHALSQRVALRGTGDSAKQAPPPEAAQGRITCEGESANTRVSGAMKEISELAKRRLEQTRERIRRAEARTRRASDKALAIQLRLARLLRGREGEQSVGDVAREGEGAGDVGEKRGTREEQEMNKEEERRERGVAGEEQQRGREGRQSAEEEDLDRTGQLLHRKQDALCQDHYARRQELFSGEQQKETEDTRVACAAGSPQTHGVRFLSSPELARNHRREGERPGLGEEPSCCCGARSTNTTGKQIQEWQWGGAPETLSFAGDDKRDNEAVRARFEGTRRRRQSEKDEDKRMLRKKGKVESSFEGAEKSRVYASTRQDSVYNSGSSSGVGGRRDVLAEMHGESLKASSDSETQQDLLNSLEKATEQAYLFPKKGIVREDASVNETSDERNSGRCAVLRRRDEGRKSREQHKEDKTGEEERGIEVKDEGAGDYRSKPGEGEERDRYSLKTVEVKTGQDSRPRDVTRSCLQRPVAAREEVARKAQETAKPSIDPVSSTTTGAWWSDKLQRRLLSMLSRLRQPRSILEIGTFTGLSTLSLAEGLRLPKESLAAERRAAFEKKGSLEQGSECILVTIERDPHAATLAMEYFAQSVYAPHIHLVRGDAGKALLNIHRAMGKKPSGATGESTASEASLLNEGDYYCPGRDRARTKKEPRTCRRGDDTRRTDSTSRGAEMTGDEANNQDKQETPLPKAERGPALSVDWTAEGGDVRRKGAATCMTTGRGEQMSYQDRLRGSLLFSEDLLPVSFSLPQLQKRSNLADEGICALPLPPDGFDLIFLDADKRNYGEYLHLILHPEKPLLARDGVLIVDNVLFTASRKNDWRASSTQEITEQENRLDESQRTLRPGNSAGEAAVAGTATGEREVEEKEEKTAHGGQSADSKKATERLRSRRTARLIKIEEEMKRVRKLLLNDERVVHVVLPIRDGISLVTWKRSNPRNPHKSGAEV